MSILATDDFAGTGALSANWTANDNNSTTMSRSSGQAISDDATSDAAYRYSGLSWPNDQYSQVILGPATAGLGSGYGACVRMDTAGTLSSAAHDTYYRLVGSAGGYERIKLVGAAGTSLESSAGTTFTSGDTLYHGIVGTQATFKKNGVTFGSPASDSAIASGASGIGHSSTSNVGDGIASWEGGDFASAVTDVSRVTPLLMTLGRPGKTARPWALPTYQPATVTVPPVPPTLSPILARFEQRFGRQPMGRVVPKESSPRNSFTFGAEVGSYALTGQSASLLATRLLNATAGTYVLTGKAAGLLAARLLNGTAGSYAITGRAALLAAARLLNAGAGAYTYTGRNGALLRGALMPAVAGAYVINGADADLQQAGAGAFVFGAAPGVYSITGFDASLIATTVTPTPTPSQSPASLGGGYGIQDRYWREREKLYDRTKRKAKKKSKKAVEIVEELALRELDLSEAIVELHEELAAANLKSAEVYVDLLRMKLEMVEEDDDDDDLLLLH